MPRRVQTTFDTSKLASQVRTLMREHRQPEKKTFTLTSPPVQSATNFSGIIIECAAIAQGTSLTTRVGDAVDVESVDFRQIWYANTSQTAPTTGRSILFMDTMNTGTAPVPTDVLDAVALGTAAAPFANYNVPNLHMHRFRVLFDGIAPLGYGGNDAHAGAVVRHIKVNRRLDFSGSASSAGLRNRLYLLYVSDVNANDILYTAQVNVNFSDA